MTMEKTIGIPRPAFSLYRPLPGHPDWQEMFDEAAELAAEIAGNIKKDSDLNFSDRLDNMARKKKSYVTTVSTFFKNRKRLKSGNHCLLPLYWIWVMHNTCNLRCTYCDDHSGQGWFDRKDENALGTEGGKKLMEIMRTGCSSIYFCGGEPTLRKDLPQLVDHGWDLGYYPMAMNSNVTVIHDRLRDPGWKDVMRKLDILVISVDALSPEKLDQVFQRPLGRTALVNALMLRELQKVNKFMLIVNSVVTKETIPEARAVLDWANDLGIFYACVPANVKEGPDPELINDPEYRDFVATLLKRKKEGHKIIGSYTLLDKFLYARPYTCMTTMKPHVGADGKLPWPCRASINIEPEYINVFDHDNVAEMYDSACRIIDPTGFHGPAKNQCGGWCAWYQNYTTEIYRQTLLRPWRFLAEAGELTSNL